MHSPSGAISRIGARSVAVKGATGGISMDELAKRFAELADKYGPNVVDAQR